MMIIKYTDVQYMSVVTSKYRESNEDEVRSFRIFPLCIVPMHNHGFIIIIGHSENIGHSFA